MKLGPWSLNSSFRNKHVKMGSQSQIIDCGIPCNFKMFSKKIWAINGATYKCRRGMKCPYLESWSTMTNKVVLPFERGNLSMKFNDILTQTWVGIGKGCRRHADACESTIWCWQTSDSQIYLQIKSFIFFQKKKLP